jgi:hypothetical protein
MHEFAGSSSLTHLVSQFDTKIDKLIEKLKRLANTNKYVDLKYELNLLVLDIIAEVYLHRSYLCFFLSFIIYKS